MEDICNALRDRAERDADHAGRMGSSIKSDDTLCGRAADKIQGLEADLEVAVEVAFFRGATEWVRSNYPDHFKRLTRIKKHQ